MGIAGWWMLMAIEGIGRCWWMFVSDVGAPTPTDAAIKSNRTRATLHCRYTFHMYMDEA